MSSEEVVNDDKAETWEDPEENKALDRVKAASEGEEAGKEKEMDDVEEDYSFDQANKESDDVINNDLKCERGWWG